MSELNFDKEVVNSYKADFDSEKNSFRNSGYKTYEYGYLKTSQEPLVTKMASVLDSLYGKIDTGYSNINEYWTDYIDASDSLETSFQSFSASCSDPVVNAYLSGFIDKIDENYYATDNNVVTFDEYYKNISIDENGKVTITMGNDGLTKFEKEYKSWCEANGKEVEVVCYTLDENGNYNLTAANPELKEKENELIKRCKAEGIDITITEDTRTVDKQNECYEKGTALIKGDGYCSDHQWGIAFDVYVNGENGEDTYTDPKYLDDWERVGEIGKELGLEWGGDWESFTDKPHFNLTGYDLTYTDDTKTAKTLSVTEETKTIDGTTTTNVVTYDNPADFSKSWDLDDD